MTAQPIALAVSTVIFALRSDGDPGGDQPGGDRGGASLRIPLVLRIREPYAGLWALPGGPIESAESLAAAAGRNLLETTGLDPTYLEQLYAFGDLERSGGDAGERVVSIVYWALVRPEEADLAREGNNVRWFPADELPQLAFDHNNIVAYALWRLRTKLEYSRIAQAFVGETFTLAELREVHEAILQKSIDPANFRRQIESSAAIIDTGERLTGAPNRPPKLYRYDTSVALAESGPLVPPRSNR